MTEPTSLLTQAPKPVRLTAGRAIIAGAANIGTPVMLTMEEVRIGLALLHPLATYHPAEEWSPVALDLCAKLLVALTAFRHVEPGQ